MATASVYASMKGAAREIGPARCRGEDGVEQHDDGEFDINSYRRMDLCAWQAGRAIKAVRSTFERLLSDSDREVAAAAAAVLRLPAQFE